VEERENNYWPLLPAQFNDIHRRPEGRPEAKLLLAMLQDAVACLVGGNPNLRVEAERWLTGLWESPLSFDAACDTLGINAGWLRQMLLRLIRQHRNPDLPNRCTPSRSLKLSQNRPKHRGRLLADRALREPTGSRASL
jgi:hypothetical protein